MSRKSKEQQFIRDAAKALSPFMGRISNMQPMELRALVKACE